MNLINLNKKCFIAAGCLSIGLAFSPLTSQSFAQFAPPPPSSSEGSKDCTKKTTLKETDGTEKIASSSKHLNPIKG